MKDRVRWVIEPVLCFVLAGWLAGWLAGYACLLVFGWDGMGRGGETICEYEYEYEYERMGFLSCMLGGDVV